MKQVILILHARGTDKRHLNELLDSIDTNYPVIVSNHDPNIWCIGAIKQLYDNLDFDEVVILNDTMVIKDNSLWDILFKEHKGKSVRLARDCLMFHAKFLKEHMPPFPEAKTKRDDVLLGEDVWCRGYSALPIEFVDLQPLYDTYQVFEDKHDRHCMVLENDYIRKYKRAWNLEMC